MQPDAGRAFGHSQSGFLLVNAYIWAPRELPWGGSGTEFEMQPGATRADAGRAFGHSQNGFLLVIACKCLHLGTQRAPGGGLHFKVPPDAGRAFGHSQSGFLLVIACKCLHLRTQRECQLPWGGSGTDFEMQPDATRGGPLGTRKVGKMLVNAYIWAPRGLPMGRLWARF